VKTTVPKLIEIATKAIKHSQAKYSNFRVGAALLTDDNKVFTGCNIESSSYGLTICAERVALVKALSEGGTKFSTIVIYAEDAEFCPPCGACRQLLFDYAPNLQIILTNGKEHKTYPLKELLPFAFEEKQLNKK
jgi:cytidine deaminase